MTDKELELKRRTLQLKADTIAGLSAFAAVGEMKTAGMLAAEITVELARRELVRNQEDTE